ncbi:MAG TPA: hypothetical protein VLA39_09160 [Marinobacterium sp.]|nr:hypothetical protein [Marinobacterium sp.]
MKSLHYAFYFFVATDLHVLIADACFKETTAVNRCPADILKHLDRELGGLKQRRVYCRNTELRFEELKHQNGIFAGFAPATDKQQLHFARLIEKHALFDAQLMTNI